MLRRGRLSVCQRSSCLPVQAEEQGTAAARTEPQQVAGPGEQAGTSHAHPSQLEDAPGQFSTTIHGGAMCLSWDLSSDLTGCPQIQLKFGELCSALASVANTGHCCASGSLPLHVCALSCTRPGPNGNLAQCIWLCDTSRGLAAHDASSCSKVQVQPAKVAGGIIQQFAGCHNVIIQPWVCPTAVCLSSQLHVSAAPHLSLGLQLLDAGIIDLPCKSLLRILAGPSLQQAPPKAEKTLHGCTPVSG